jgi:hypothetical protein
VSPSHCPYMDTLTKIPFDQGLGRLQELLGRELRIAVNFHGTFGACLMQGRLTRVQTLPPDHQAIDILLDDAQALMLDPIDALVLAVEDEAGDGPRLEFHLPSGVVATIQGA